ELARVLKPGGKLALVWNTRDERADWVRRLTELIDVHEGGAPRHRTGRWRECFARARSFTELQRVDVEHVHSGTVDTVVDRVVSISFIAALPEAERARVAAAVRELVATHPDTRERSRIDFPYVTSLYFCARIPS
ncbi:MAG: SAM-dependent methyltransferase, partial [Deltaproteobacteria bacterium]|nr:SAM-dependent methyltransferase [Deltaproteobacteria bacterium]